MMFAVARLVDEREGQYVIVPGLVDIPDYVNAWKLAGEVRLRNPHHVFFVVSNPWPVG